jgi:hypothetical protein
VPSRRGPDNSIRVAIAGTANGLNVVNIFHAQLTTSGSVAQADLDAWLSSFALAFKARFQSLLANQYQFVSAQAVLYTPGGGELTSTYQTGWTATGGSSSTPMDVCVVVSWNSTVYWRGGKPRTYFSPVVTAAVDPTFHLVSSTYRTNYGAAAANFLTDVNGLSSGSITGTTFGFVSYFSGNVARAAATFFAITGATIHSRLGSQRRRLGKWAI